MAYPKSLSGACACSCKHTPVVIQGMKVLLGMLAKVTRTALQLTNQSASFLYFEPAGYWSSDKK